MKLTLTLVSTLAVFFHLASLPQAYASDLEPAFNAAIDPRQIARTLAEGVAASHHLRRDTHAPGFAKKRRWQKIVRRQSDTSFSINDVPAVVPAFGQPPAPSESVPAPPEPTKSSSGGVLVLGFSNNSPPAQQVQPPRDAASSSSAPKVPVADPFGYGGSDKDRDAQGPGPTKSRLDSESSLRVQKTGAADASSVSASVSSSSSVSASASATPSRIAKVQKEAAKQNENLGGVGVKVLGFSNGPAPQDTRNSKKTTKQDAQKDPKKNAQKDPKKAANDQKNRAGDNQKQDSQDAKATRAAKQGNKNATKTANANDGQARISATQGDNQVKISVQVKPTKTASSASDAATSDSQAPETVFVLIDPNQVKTVTKVVTQVVKVTVAPTATAA